jgi:hypothetical protein
VRLRHRPGAEDGGAAVAGSATTTGGQGAGLQTAMVSRSANAGPAAAPGILGRFRSGP